MLVAVTQPSGFSPRTVAVAQIGRILGRVSVSEPVAKVIAAHAFGIKGADDFAQIPPTSGAAR